MKRILVALNLLTAPAMLGASGEDQIRAAEKNWAEAVVARNVAALDKIFTDKLIYAHSTGIIENKQQYLERLKSGAQKYEKVHHEETRVVLYGDSAAAHSMVRMSGNSSGRLFDDHVMMMHLWVKQGGTWRLAAHQTTKLAQ